MKIRPCLSKNALLIIYHSLIMRQIRYCIINWCFKNVTWIKKLQKICNKFLKLTFDIYYKDDITPIMHENKFLSINNLYKFETAQIMFKHKNKQLPQAFQNFFTLKTLCMKTRSNSQSIFVFAGPQPAGNLYSL